MIETARRKRVRPTVSGGSYSEQSPEYRAEVDRTIDRTSLTSPVTGCRCWLGATNSGGYGEMRIAGRKQRVHRVAYERAHGPIPHGFHVLHGPRCSRLCTRADHLRLGVHGDNMMDRDEHGRTARGGRNGKSKLTEWAVTEILRSDEPHAALANAFGVNESTVRGIRTGRAWNHVRSDIVRRGHPRAKHSIIKRAL